MAEESTRDYYADLGVLPTADVPTIKLAFYKLAKMCHPDKARTDDSSAFVRAREAYEVLSDAGSRAEYNGMLRRARMDREFEEEVWGATAEEDDDDESGVMGSWSPLLGWESEEEFGCGGVYGEGQKRDGVHGARCPERKEGLYTVGTRRAHGLEVKMTHPAGTQHCLYKSEHWKMQAGGEDFCVFCVLPSTGARRCPGCEALACRKCMEKIVELERDFFGRLG